MYSSPRRQSHSDSLDYDDELAELMTRSKDNPIRVSDEDTEDASEDGGDRESFPLLEEKTAASANGKSGAVTEIKEQVYQDKLKLLRGLLSQLRDETHPEYCRGVEKITASYNHRIELSKIYEHAEKIRIEEDFLQEKEAALREFEEKKIELKENMLASIREERKQYDLDRITMDINSDNTEVKNISTRKLRRRPNDPPAPPQEKRRKPPTSQLTFLLDEKEIEEDLLAIFNARARAAPSTPKKSSTAGENEAGTSNGVPTANTTTTANKSRSKSKSPSPVLASDIRIEDGKLFYEKRWFHRGQQVYLEGRDTPLTSALISAIGHDAVWVRKSGGDNTKIRVTLSQLIKGKYSLKRRA